MKILFYIAILTTGVGIITSFVMFGVILHGFFRDRQLSKDFERKLP